jgi:hypothetical protein
MMNFNANSAAGQVFPQESLPIVYHRSTDRTAGLLFLLDFALKHRPCHQWIGAITLLLQQEGRDG